MAYETIKRCEREMTPCRPTALVVSGCPCPSMFPQAYQCESFDFLQNLRDINDVNSLTKQQLADLQEEFDVNFDRTDSDPVNPELYRLKLAQFYQNSNQKNTLDEQNLKKQAFLSDLKCLQSYEKWRTQHKKDEQKIYAPLCALDLDADDTTDESALKNWSDFTLKEFTYQMLSGKELKNPHTFSQQGCQSLLRAIEAICRKYELPDKMNILPDVGDLAGPFPDFVEAIVVGGGIGGVNQMRMLNECGVDALCIDRRPKIGGVWLYHGNKYSRVNSSEPAYRIIEQGHGPDVRVNEDHSPCCDIVYDIYSVAAKYSYGKFRTNCEVLKVDKEKNGIYKVQIQNLLNKNTHLVETKGVAFLINRRLGASRLITYDNEEKFRGEVYYGYGNQIRDVNWHNKNVVILGCGAFALENMRTALEHGAKTATIVARRRGTVCPKWIDLIHFFRPFTANLKHYQAGDLVCFAGWSDLYKDSGATSPDCWKEGLLKPNGHTISVSDIFFQGAHLNCADVRVDSIREMKLDGYGAILKSGASMDFDIMVKCVGFHTMKDVSRITGQTKMFSHQFIDTNMAYFAEPLLDSGFFGNAFGSSYVGLLMHSSKMFAKWFKDPEWQNELHAIMEKNEERTTPVDDMWATYLLKAHQEAVETLRGKSTDVNATDINDGQIPLK